MLIQAYGIWDLQRALQYVSDLMLMGYKVNITYEQELIVLTW